MRLRDIRGLKFPDSYVVRFFFKEALHETPGRVLEAGCGNGNNLALFHAYGWNVTGADLNEKALADARANLKQIEEAKDRFTLVQADLSKGIGPVEGPFDAGLVPNVLCYLGRERASALLDELAGHLKPGAHFFLRTRGTGDYRFGRGELVETNGFVLDTPETGEAGLLNVFYREHELVEMVRDRVGLEPSSLRVFNLHFDNLQGGRTMTNHDIVVWGRRSGC